MKIAFLLSLLFILSSCNSSEKSNTQSLGASSPESVNSSLAIRWSDSSLPLSVYTSDDFSFDAGDYNSAGENPIEQMQKEWDNAVTGKNLFNYSLSAIASKGNDSLSSYKDSNIGIYISDEWFSDVTSSALAITQFYAYKKTDSSGEFYELSHGDIIVNNKDHDFSYNVNSGANYDMSTVILHELGHLLGLTHQSSTSIPAVMQPYLSVMESNRELFADDSQRISDNYTDTSLMSGDSMLSANYQPSGIPDGEELHGIIELMASGECRHFINGKLTQSHFSF